MTDPKDKEFNETLKRMMDAKPKPHEEMKKGRDCGKRRQKKRPDERA